MNRTATVGDVLTMFIGYFIADWISFAVKIWLLA